MWKKAYEEDSYQLVRLFSIKIDVFFTYMALSLENAYTILDAASVRELPQKKIDSIMKITNTSVQLKFKVNQLLICIVATRD